MGLRSDVESGTETECACVLKSVSNLAPPTGLHATAHTYSRSEENTACCSKTMHRLDAHSDKQTHGMHTFCLALHAISASRSSNGKRAHTSLLHTQRPSLLALTQAHSIDRGKYDIWFSWMRRGKRILFHQKISVRVHSCLCHVLLPFFNSFHLFLLLFCLVSFCCFRYNLISIWYYIFFRG